MSPTARRAKQRFFQETKHKQAHYEEPDVAETFYLFDRIQEFPGLVPLGSVNGLGELLLRVHYVADVSKLGPFLVWFSAQLAKKIPDDTFKLTAEWDGESGIGLVLVVDNKSRKLLNPLLGELAKKAKREFGR